VQKQPATQKQFAFMEYNVPRRKRPDRLFFCLRVDERTALISDRIGRGIKHEYDVSARMRPLPHLHISLQHIGDYPHLKDRHVFAAMLAARMVSFEPFPITLDRFEAFPSRKPANYPCVLCGNGTGAIFDLHRLLALAMLKNGMRAGFEFVPHVTLFYAPFTLPPRMIEPVTFTVREFCLIHSIVGETRYEQLGTWPLRG
jgi:2'-5' RNA ligase